jgi:hypothetical protein
VDLLGVREMTRSPKAGKYLKDLDDAVSGMYRDFLQEDSPWPAALFSDTLVLCSPILDKDEGRDAAERSAVASVVQQAAYLQVTLLERGFFMRGAVTLGDFHIHDKLIFGAALVEGAELEHKAAVHPRIVLSDEALKCQRPPRGSIAEIASQPDLLLRDNDGRTFVNYLATLFDDLEDPADNLGWHRDLLEKRLEEHREDKRRWEKYRWTAEYHNEFVRRTLDDPRLLVPPEHMTWRFSDPFPRRGTQVPQG